MKEQENIEQMVTAKSVEESGNFGTSLYAFVHDFNNRLGSNTFEDGAVHGALVSTTPGNTSMTTRKEVRKKFGGGACVQR